MALVGGRVDVVVVDVVVGVVDVVDEVGVVEDVVVGVVAMMFAYMEMFLALEKWGGNVIVFGRFPPRPGTNLS